MGVLTFAAALVAQFATQGVALFLRADEASSGLIGLLYIAAIPYTLRFLWSPLVDRNRLGSAGRYAGWITWSQAAACLAVASLFLFPPDVAPIGILALVSIFMIALGTQLTAVGGLMAAALPGRQFASGSSVQDASSALGGMFLGAFVLYLLADLGWFAVVWALLVVAGLGLVFSAIYAPRVDVEPVAMDRPPILSHLRVLQTREARQLFAVTFLVNCAIIIPYAAKSVMLIDAGFSIADASLYGIVFGNAVGALAALSSRPFIDRIGPMRFLGTLGILNILGVAVILFQYQDGFSPVVTVVMVLFANASVFAAFTASRAAIMALCEQGRQATDFASFVGLETVLYLVFAGISLAFLDTLGFVAISLFGGALTALGLLVVFAGRKKPQNR